MGAGADRWIVVPHPGVTVTSLDAIACPTTTTCEVSDAGSAGAAGVIRLDGDPGTLAVDPLWVPSVSTDTLPTAVRSVGTLACPTATTCLATAVGDNAGPGDATVITVPVSPVGGSTWVPESTFPTGASTVTGISCTTTTCIAIGTATGAAAVWTADLTGATHAWSQATGFPSSVLAVTSVACGSPALGDTADCAVAAITSSPSGSGELLDGSLTNGSWVWNPAPVPADEGLQYLLGVSCMTPAAPGTATSAAVGATPGGPVVLTSANGPSGTWTDQTPGGLSGEVATGIPLEISPSDTTSWTTQVPAGQTPNATTLPNVLYPQPPGYSIAAGDCPTEATSTAIANLNAQPGGIAQVTVPLGTIPLQLVTSTGAPVSGATVTLTSTTCGGADSYNLPVTDPTGETTAAVPYGSYSYTVTQGSTAVAHTAVTITVGGSTVQVTTAGSTVTDYLPGVAQVQA